MKLNVLAVAGFLSLGVMGLSAQSTTTVNGFVSESHCGADHSSPSADATKCIKKCLKGGSDPVLVSNGKVYKIKGEESKVKGLAGQNVTVTGTVEGDTITVNSVSAQKAS
ncbi:MAG TPA: hypothetical protein VKX41_17725 [Alloacidobacterium sp.]|jgi:hypothetical protein|nr:hypothetical protein [Alloacidobacterium sp.]